ncbi:uncharacterized protein LOC111637210 [Centruroides sculpturatus]|uniref:uncharacterized protein LOC111637210 n=1 Tax=Centruroides sculpturatus TaxID=218467 RepID=UPI000C6DB228|nr:uncharacterized protein LOC111637210 [Centruroides sculpturatus]
MYVSYRQSLIVGDVHQQLMKHQEEEIVQNTEYLAKLTDIILILVRQGLSLRGHRKDASSKNRGNFLEIAQLFCKYDDKFLLHFEKHNYCSPDIQNEIIEVISNLTLEEIVEEAKAFGFFSLSVDEARCFKEEQLSMTIRYANGLDIVEMFIGFTNCSTSRDAQGLAILILDTLNKHHLGDVPILAHSYDGASVMSAKTFFNGLEALYIHFAQPGHHASLQKLQGALGIHTSRETGSLSTTRWSCHYENCQAVLTNYEIQNATLGQASHLITNTIDTFEACRNQFKIWTDIEQFSEKHEISHVHVRVSKRRRQQKEFYTESTVSKSNTLDFSADSQPEEYWKFNVYYQVVDNIIVNLKHRFENLPLARAVDAFLKLDMKNGEDFISNYKKNLKN